MESAFNARDDVDQMLEAFQNERLEPKAVEEILGITAQERRRWSKDGRLPKSGTGQFKKGQHVFQYFLHPADGIAKIARDPQIIARWRVLDSQKAD